MKKTGYLTEVLESGIVKYQDLDAGVTRYHGKTELDAAGFIRAEENDKRTHIKNS